MKTSSRPVLSLVLLLIAVLALPAAAENGIYRWRDERGVTHYSASSPPGVETRKIEPPPLPDSASRESAEQRLQRELEDARVAQVARRNKALEEATRREARQRDEAEHLARCGLAQRNLRVLSEGGAVFVRDARGNRAYLDDAQRERQIAQARKEVAEACRGIDSSRAAAATGRAAKEVARDERCAAAREQLAELANAGRRIDEVELGRVREEIARVCASAR